MTLLHSQVQRLSRNEVDRMSSDELEGMELVDGILVEKPAMGIEAFWIATKVAHILMQQVPEEFGFVVTEPFLYPFDDQHNARRPDVCFIHASKFPDGLPKGNPAVVPDLVVEVLSPTDKMVLVEDRIKRYLIAGTTAVWLVNPELRSVRLHRPDGTAQTFDGEQEITGEQLLPMFRCAVSRFFPVQGRKR